MSAIYTFKDVARIFGLKESRLRYWAQTGFITPSGRAEGRQAYTFGDLVEVKAAMALLDAGIPLQRVRKNLQALRGALPEEHRPLSRLRVRSDGDSLVVSDADATFNPISGQLLLDFDLEALGREAAKVLALEDAAAKRAAQANGAGAGQAATSRMRVEVPSPEEDLSPRDPADPAGGPPQTAYAWFLRGCGLDADPARRAEAISAYQEAVRLDPSLAAAHTNLGNLYYGQHEKPAARRCYEAALALDPDQPEARYNLANLYDEAGEADLAIAEYRRALVANPAFADAHFNLALSLEAAGSRVQARQHWRRYLELVPEAEVHRTWRTLARQHLDALEG